MVTSPEDQARPAGASYAVTFRLRNNTNTSRTFGFNPVSSDTAVVAHPNGPSNQVVAPFATVDVNVLIPVSGAAPGSSAVVSLTAMDLDDRSKTHTASFTHTVANRAPTARFSLSASSVVVSDTISFDASDSSDPDGDSLTYVWDMGNGAVAYGRELRFHYYLPGTFTVTLTVTDAAGASASATQVVTVRPNQAPQARFVYSPAAPAVGDTILFDAFGSGDPDGDSLSYVWDMGNGAVAYGRELRFHYYLPGPFTVTLTVTDTRGASSSTSQELAIPTSRPPHFADNVRYKPMVVGPGRHTAGYTIRNQSTVDRTYAFYPTEITGALTFPSVPLPLTLAPGEERHVLLAFDVPAHLAEGASLDLVLRATDSEGASYGAASVTIGLVVTHLRPRVVIEGGGYQEGSPGQTKVIRVHVTNPLGEPRLVCAQWLADEVYIGQDQVSRPEPSHCHGLAAGETRPFEFTYRFHDNATPGLLDRHVLQVFTHVETEHNSAWAQLYTRTVSAAVNRAPAAGFTWSPAAPYPGDAVTFDASSSSDPDGDVLTYAWTLGNGAAAYTRTVTTTYGVADSFPVTLTVSDPQGASNSVSRNVIVRTDTEPPTITFLRPSGTRFSNPYGIVEIDWRDNRGLNVETIEITEQGIRVPPERMPLFGEFATSRQTHLSLLLEPGANVVRATASDLAGNAAVPVEVVYYYDPPGVQVTPDDAAVTLGPSGTYTWTFTVQNTGSAPAPYDLKAECDAPLYNCAILSSSFSSLGAGQSGSVTVQFTTGSTGGTSGGLRLRATVTTPPQKEDVGSVMVHVAAGKIVITPSSGTIQAPGGKEGHKLAFTIGNYTGEDVHLGIYPVCHDAAVLSHCVMQSGDALRFFTAGQTQTVYVVANTGPSGAVGTLSLTANIPDRHEIYTNAVFTVQLGDGGGGETPVAAVVAAPQPSGPLPLNKDASTTMRFTVRNPGSVPATYVLEPSCTPGVLGCSLPFASSRTVDAGNSVDVDVQVTAPGAVGSSGTVTLTTTLSGTGMSSSASQGVTIMAPNSLAPTVALDEATAMPLIERDLCLTIAVGHAGASECGDLRLAHALPSIRTLNKARTPVLLYNSQHAEPTPLIALDVTTRAGTQPLEEVVVTVTGGAANAPWTVEKRFAGAGFPAGQARRVVISDSVLNGLPTGIHAYQVTVAAVHTGMPPHPAAARPGELVVVNRKLDAAGTQANRLGAGWWLAGLERIHHRGDNTLVWIGGDGSVRRYTPAGDGTWSGPPLEGPDRIVPGPNHGYVRELRGGARVIFNAGGQHVATENRLGHRTVFEYDGESLSKTTVPAPGAPLSYVFDYGTPNQVRVAAPGTPARQTVLHLSGGKVERIEDPDQTWVGLEYQPGTARVQFRSNRLRHRSEYRYDGAGKVVSGKIHMAPAADSIVVGLTPKESRGHAGPVPLDSVNTLMDGPRTEVPDTIRFWLDRFGAPTQIRNALGHITEVERGDHRFPALVTEVRYPETPAGRKTTRAEYNERGNVRESREVAPYGGGDAVTTFYYTDTNWPDFATKIIRPNDEVSEFGYDDRGNRTSQQDGRGPPSRVSFTYTADGLLETARSEAALHRGEAAERIEYDTQLRNLWKVITPLGIVTETRSDELGRPYLTLTPTDSAQSVARMRRDTTVYDLMGRILRTESFGPAVSYWTQSTLEATSEERVEVVNDYDLEGNLKSVARRSVPDPGKIESVVTRWEYDRANRRTVEIAPDTTPENLTDNPREVTQYDAAGNVVAVTTRRSYTIRMQYDVLNRLEQRIVPEAPHESASALIAGPGTYPDSLRHWQFPLYLRGDDGTLSVRNVAEKSSGGPLVVPADTFRYEYDAAGSMTHADNRAARIRRHYYRNGALKADTLWTATYTGQFVPDLHVYGLRYEYDLNGRRTWLHHPGLLVADAPWMARVGYTYEPETGHLQAVTDNEGKVLAQYTYDWEGRLTQTFMPTWGSVLEQVGYDPDGRLAWQHRDRSGLAVQRDTFTYDVRGKRVRVEGIGETARTAHTGLGALAWGYTDNLRRQVDLAETYSPDALGNTWEVRRVHVDESKDLHKVDRERHVYEKHTGRLLQLQNLYEYGDTPINSEISNYDIAGNRVAVGTTKVIDYPGLTNGPVPGVADFAEITRSYYGADDKLYVVDRRACAFGRQMAEPKRWDCYPPMYNERPTFEEYRYDALGRRVLTRTRQTWACENRCVNAFTRTVWDGDQVLHEIRAPNSEPEKDTGWLLPWGGDQHFFGRVGYVHAAGLDQPLALVRMNYDTLHPAPQVILPHLNWRGVYEGGTFDDGTSTHRLNGEASRCVQIIERSTDNDPAGPEPGGEPGPVEPSDTVNICVEVDWPAPNLWLNHKPRDRGPIGPASWMGSLIENKRDATGQLYMRNRYYDPQTGRFTQEDPIGLAGGLNIYGFANGDPVSYSDPYGLCPIPLSSCLGREGADLGAGFVPVVSTIHDGATVLTGRNHVTDEKVGAGGRFVAFIGMVSPASGGQIRAGAKTLSATGELVKDFVTNPDNWKRVGSFIEEAVNRRARGGASIQDVFENANGDRMVQHTVVDRSGNAVDGPHPRPFYKPRKEEVDP